MLAEGLSGATGAVFLRVDTIEQGLRDLAGIQVEGEGYRLAYRIAADNLRLGHHVVADSCNPIELTRNEWNSVAEQANAAVCNIEVICSDPNEHRSRVESRSSSIANLKLPSWSDILQREYHAWSDAEVIRLDTAGKEKRASLDELMALVAALESIAE